MSSPLAFRVLSLRWRAPRRLPLDERNPPASEETRTLSPIDCGPRARMRADRPRYPGDCRKVDWHRQRRGSVGTGIDRERDWRVGRHLYASDRRLPHVSRFRYGALRVSGRILGSWDFGPGQSRAALQLSGNHGSGRSVVCWNSDLHRRWRRRLDKPARFSASYLSELPEQDVISSGILPPTGGARGRLPLPVPFGDPR